jgi:hypothetical protein
MELFGQPSKTFLSSLISNSLTIEQLTIPLAGAVISLLLMAFLFLKWRLPRYVKKCQENIDNLVNLDTAYRETTWSRIKNKVSTLISDPKLKGIYYPHPKNLNKIEKFIKEDLNKYYEMIR